MLFILKGGKSKKTDFYLLCLHATCYHKMDLCSLYTIVCVKQEIKPIGEMGISVKKGSSLLELINKLIWKEFKLLIIDEPNILLQITKTKPR